MIYYITTIVTILGTTEKIYPLVNESITLEIIIKAAKTTFIIAVSADGLGIISIGIGFIRKSMQTTIISTVLLCLLSI